MAVMAVTEYTKRKEILAKKSEGIVIIIQLTIH